LVKGNPPHAGWDRARLKKPAREFALNKAPTQREIPIALWEGPDRMQMIRQDTYRQRPEGIVIEHKLVPLTQMIDASHQEIG
jgi:hypothetical protein